MDKKRLFFCILFVCFLIGGFAAPVKTTLAAAETQKDVIVTFKQEINENVLPNSRIKKKHKRLHAVSLKLSNKEIEKYKKDPAVKSIEPDIELKADVQSVSSNNLTEEGIQKNPEGSFTGKNIKIAIVDTGIDLHHQDLKVAGGQSFVSYTSSYDDDHGHGTHVAGIIGALNNGIGIIGQAPDSELYALKALDSDGNGKLSSVISAIEWSIANDMDIINLSLSTDINSVALNEAVNLAYQEGILIVASAGNNGSSNGNQDNIQYPAKYLSVISVGSIDSKNKRSVFSATGPSLEVMAPGEEIHSAYINNSYSTISGTSVATSFVTGMLAQMKEEHPNLNNKELREILDRNAMDLGETGRDNQYGYGLAQLGESPNPNPTLPETEDKDQNSTTKDGSVKVSLAPWQVAVSGNSPTGRTYGITWVTDHIVLKTARSSTNYEQVCNLSVSELVPDPTKFKTLDKASWSDSNLYVEFTTTFGVRYKTFVNPLAPINVSPGNSYSPPIIPIDTPPTLMWKLQSNDAVQTAYQVVVESSNHVPLYDSKWVSSSNTNFTLPSGILKEGSLYYWRVSIRNEKGEPMPFSNYFFFRTNYKPYASFTSYNDGQELTNNSSINLTWSYSDSNGSEQQQNYYQIQASRDNWSSVAFDSGKLIGSSKSYSINKLEAGAWSFRVFVSDGLDWSTPSFRTNLIVPDIAEPNNTIEQAYSLITSNMEGFLINSATDVDYFSFKASLSEREKVVLDVPSGKDYDIYIYNKDQKLITSGILGTGITEEVFFKVEAGQTYFIKVVGYKGAYSLADAYSLTVDKAGSAIYEYHYDPLGRIDYVIIDGKSRIEYIYDNNGNLTQVKTPLKVSK
ncbi:S8 family peptidase [Paenibacillus spiritus]|uniref:S8 family peptidase n=1 Tax=Paenibacillus spiritus TaxID=2496557 RepID=UPI00168AF1FC|nr:S8 family peptidase [Paenibacillus spiritus]